MLPSAFDKGKYFAGNFSINSILGGSGISLPAFPSKTNMKLHYISLIPKLVKKLTTNHDLSKASGPDCIPALLLKRCEPELSYILAELFSRCWKESWFNNFLAVNNYSLISLISMVSKVSEKPKCGLTSSMVSGALDLLIYVSDNLGFLLGLGLVKL